MNKNILIIAGIFGATGVSLGALGAHYLNSKILTGLISQEQVDAFDTATKYQLLHTLALLFLYLVSRERKIKLITISANLFVTGIFLFSGSLYLLATKNLIGIENLRFLGPITPIGGLVLIAAWFCLILHGFALKKTEKSQSNSH